MLSNYSVLASGNQAWSEAFSRQSLHDLPLSDPSDVRVESAMYASAKDTPASRVPTIIATHDESMVPIFDLATGSPSQGLSLWPTLVATSLLIAP